MGNAATKIQLRRRPNDSFVQSDMCPMNGSVTASHRREIAKIIPIVPGEIKSVSVANFMEKVAKSSPQHPVATSGET
eukprot:4200807-Prymnesium_polylepis.3